MTATLSPIASAAVQPAVIRTVASDLLGSILAAPEACYRFPVGLYGFEACREFVLVPAGRPALYWLQSTRTPSLVFLLAEPGHFFPLHDIDVPASEFEAIGGASAPAHEFAAFAIVTLGHESGTATANIQAPIVLHMPSRTARQVVVDDGEQHVRAPIAIG